jgi:DNA-binding FrmR family transcriptional regulator
MIIPEYKAQLQTALKKVQGTLAKVESMINEEAYCPKTVQMISAAEGLLRGAKLKMLENHLQTCGHEKMASANATERAEFAKEVIKTLDISSRK